MNQILQHNSILMLIQTVPSGHGTLNHTRQSAALKISLECKQHLSCERKVQWYNNRAGFFKKDGKWGKKMISVGFF